MEASTKQNSLWSIGLRLFFRDYTAVFGLAVVVLLLVFAFGAPLLANNRPIMMTYEGSVYFPAVREVLTRTLGFRWEYEFYRNVDPMDFLLEAKAEGDIGMVLMPLVPWSPYEIDWASRLEGPSARHWFGTDDLGRDVFARMIHGAAASLLVGFISTGIALVLGLFLGALAGYFGGWVDMVIMRLIEVVMCFPTFFLILTVIAFLEPSLTNIMITIGLTAWTSFARMVRAEFIRLKGLDFATAAMSLGAGNGRIMFRHLLPNAMAPILVMVSFRVASAILLESGLSFLGFGIQPPNPSWGGVLAGARQHISIAWWLAVFPGIAIFLGVMGYNLVGEGLRDAFDPRNVK